MQKETTTVFQNVIKFVTPRTKIESFNSVAEDENFRSSPYTSHFTSCTRYISVSL